MKQIIISWRNYLEYYWTTKIICESSMVPDIISKIICQDIFEIEVKDYE